MRQHGRPVTADAGPGPTDWLTTAQAGPLLCGVCVRTVLNHMTVGTRTPGGVVRLKYQQLGGRKYTRPEWVAEYLEAIRRATDSGRAVPPTAPVETPDQQGERGRAAKERVASMFDRKANNRRPRR